MEIYLVGGAIRDKLLGLDHDETEKDYVVVGSTPNEMKSLGFRQVGKDFPVFLHPQTKEEYALARLERKVSVGYSGFEFDTSKTVTLEQDLSRRDLTINAIAQKKEGNGNLIDPYGGIEDIKLKKLRHVSDAFSEDPVRILRIARFASQFHNLGFTIDKKTFDLIKKMVTSGEVDALVPERIFIELCRAFESDMPSIFFEVLKGTGAYQRIFPMIKIIDDKNAQLLDESTELSEVKFALLLYQQNKEDIKELCDYLKCPKDFHQIAELVSEWHSFAMDFMSHSSQDILSFYLNNDALRRQRRFEILLTTFSYLEINTKPIIELLGLLKSIKISSLKNINIAQEIAEERLLVIASFINSTK